MSLWSSIKAWFVKEEVSLTTQLKQIIAEEKPKVEAAVVKIKDEVVADVVAEVKKVEEEIVAEAKKVVERVKKTRKSKPRNK